MCSNKEECDPLASLLDEEVHLAEEEEEEEDPLSALLDEQTKGKADKVTASLHSLFRRVDDDFECGKDELFTGKYKQRSYPTMWTNRGRVGKLRSEIHLFLHNLYVRLIILVIAFAGVIHVTTSLAKGDTLPRVVNPLLIAIFFTLEFALRAISFGKTLSNYWNHMIGGLIVVLSFLVAIIVAARWSRTSPTSEALLYARVFLFLLLFVYAFSSLPLALRYKASRSHPTRQRYVHEGFDLDLTYITPNVIGMSFPSSGLGEIQHFPPVRIDGCLGLRNPRTEVSKFFNDKYRDGRYRIYNLCKERKYDTKVFQNQVKCYEVEDHSVPKLAELVKFCRNVDEYLSEDENRVIAVHCRAGKGRTRMFISAWLVYSGIFETATEALEYFNSRRIDLPAGNKYPVLVIPSQRRYVKYIETLVTSYDKRMPEETTVFIKSIEIGGLDASILNELKLKILVRDEVKYEFVTGNLDNDGSYRLTLPGAVAISDDVLFAFFSPTLGTDWNSCSFFFWLHTSFIDNNKFEADRNDIGNAFKWKNLEKYSADFYVRLIFSDIDTNSLNTSDDKVLIETVFTKHNSVKDEERGFSTIELC